jgi:branched-chain amino acid transport system ATP-binding protein
MLLTSRRSAGAVDRARSVQDPRQINREDKVTILVVEQNAQLALELADKAYVIETGRIVMSGSAAEIANNEDVRKSYLGY